MHGSDEHGPLVHPLWRVRVTAVQFALAYPSVLLPNTTAGAPYKLPADTATLNGLPVNPMVTEPGGGYGFIICNTSQTASHTIQDVVVSIAQFTGYTGRLRPGSSATAFTSAPREQLWWLWWRLPRRRVGPCHVCPRCDDRGERHGAPIHHNRRTRHPGAAAADLAGPGQQLIINVGLTPPAAAGTYSFGFSLVFDDGQPQLISTMAPTLFDSAAAKWTAQACTDASMLSQIPASDTSGKYVCQEQP